MVTRLNVFHGSDAVASLKQARRARPSRRCAGFPRQRCRGLIEARSCRRGPGSCTGVFPRQRCRGLIEAKRPRVYTREASAVFHGSDAVASLKRLASVGCSPLLDVFHGSDAVASLKPRKSERLRPPPRSVFHGSDAVASLKQCAYGASWPSLRGFPRQRCRGLIEAGSRI